jgi:tight adherence protein B
MNEDMILMMVIFGATTFFVLGVGYFIYSFFASEQVAVQKRFDNLSKQSSAHQFQKQALTYLKEDGTWKQMNIFEDLPPFMNLPFLFDQAGMKMHVGRWLLTVVIVACVISATVWVITQKVLFLLFAASISLLFPYLMILYKRKCRLAAFEANLAQALELTSRSLRAGHPLAMGMKMVASEMSDPISTEFGIVYYEQQMGLPMEDALKRMAKRVPLLDLRFFVLSVMIHQQTGGDLSEVLDNLSGVIRERYKVLGQVKALTAEGKLSGWVLSGLPFVVCIMIMVVNPEYIKILLQEEVGRKALYFAGFLQVIGMVIIQKMVRIKV